MFCLYAGLLFSNLAFAQINTVDLTSSTAETQKQRVERLQREKFKMMESAQKAKEKAFSRRQETEKLRKGFADKRKKITEDYQTDILRVDRDEKRALEALNKKFAEEDAAEAAKESPKGN